MDSADYIVIGGGAAGCAVAARLSENPENQVVLLEAGGPDRNIAFRLPFMVFLVATSQAYNAYYETEPIPGLNNRRLKLQHGRVLGGSSSVNGMQFTRGRSLEYDAWLKAGCEGWGFDDVLPYFKKLETHSRGASRLHGSSGPVRIEQASSSLPIGDAFLRAAKEAGYPILDDLNSDAAEGFGFSDVNIDRGQRSSAASAYLRPARSRKNLRVLTGAEALRIVIEKGKAKGVEFVHEGARKTMRCDREVIVCAGAIKSPHLLLLSGIGPADHLRGFGIPVIADSPRVGKNFQNHAAYRLQYTCNAPVTSYKYLHPMNALKEGINYVLFRKGALGETALTVSGTFRTDETLEIADASISLITAIVAPPSSPNPSFRDLLPKEDGFTCWVKIVSFSRGEVFLRSADALEKPRIQPNYFDDPRDMQALLRAVPLMREVMNRSAIARFIKAEVHPGVTVNDAVALEAEIRQNASHSSHPGGTCAMGGDTSSVVDPQLRVRGVDGLRVADPSIMPTVPNAGPHAAALMIGEKAAATILAG